LPPQDLKQLTGKVRGKDQVAALNKMGIQHTRRADGEVIVSVSHIEKLLGGNVPESSKNRSTPNWDMM